MGLYHLPVSAVPLLQDPPFVCWLLLLGAAIGDRVLRILRAPLGTVSALEHGVLSTAVGLGSLQFLAFGLGMAGGLQPGTVWAGLITLTLLFAPDALRVLRGLGRTIRRRQRALPERWILVGLLLLAIPLAIALCQTLCPPMDSDGLIYHLTAPKRWLQSHSLRYLPTLVHTNAPMGVEMLFTLAMAIWSDTAAKLIHYAFGLLTLLAIFALGRRLRNEALGFTAACAFVLGLPLKYPLQYFTVAYVDMGSTFQTVCATLAWLLWRRTGARGWLSAAALCAGFAGSFKLMGVFVAITFGLLVLLDRRRTRPDSTVGSARGSIQYSADKLLGSVLRDAAHFAALASLPILPWLWRSWLLTGNPVYPLLSNLFPTRDWNPTAAAEFDMHFKYFNWDGRFFAGWSLEARRAARTLGLIATPLAGLWAIRRARSDETRALLAGVTLLIFLNIATIGYYVRFYFPVLPLLILLLLRGVAQPLASLRWVHGLVLLLLVTNTVRYLGTKREAVVFAMVLPIRELTLREAVEAATGRTSRALFLRQHLPVTRLWNYVNTALPAGGPILSPLPAAAYYSDRDTVAPVEESIRLDSTAHLTAYVRQRSIRYLVLPEEAAHDDSFPEVQRLIEMYGVRLFVAGGFGLYDLRTLPPATP